MVWKQVVVAHSTPGVADAVLIGEDGAASNIAAGSPAYQVGLEDASTFAFRGAEGGFTPTLSFR